VALSAATVLEVAAYYIPAIDNAFDVIAGPAAVVAGILAIAAVATFRRHCGGVWPSSPAAAAGFVRV
jgi:hypothetical protein